MGRYKGRGGHVGGPEWQKGEVRKEECYLSLWDFEWDYVWYSPFSWWRLLHKTGLFTESREGTDNDHSGKEDNVPKDK